MSYLGFHTSRVVVTHKCLQCHTRHDMCNVISCHESWHSTFFKRLLRQACTKALTFHHELTDPLMLGTAAFRADFVEIIQIGVCPAIFSSGTLPVTTSMQHLEMWCHVVRHLETQTVSPRTLLTDHYALHHSAHRPTQTCHVL